ncbi:hypothetical protein HPB47_010915 [Ixodes persulcatus]|uniref:Uncharacterized protein n=1 Tax=Ixodes persulcatus TaxID=34615 RepID=A0AC60NXS6_IXOPE|nr:hypothetical protein HPB47_010915 [Ixodes persulcatus]
MISDQYDDILHRLNEQENDIKDLKKRVDKIERADAANEVRELRSELNELEWRSRQKNIEIHGVLETEGEDLLGVVKSVASKLGVEELKTEEVSAVHRLPSKPGKTRGIIVSFARQETRDAWLSKKRVLNRSSGSGRLFITENMTKQGRTLLWQAREWAKVLFSVQVLCPPTAYVSAPFIQPGEAGTKASGHDCLFWADVRPIFLASGIVLRLRFTSGKSHARTWGWGRSSDHCGVGVGVRDATGRYTTAEADGVCDWLAIVVLFVLGLSSSKPY